MDGARTAVETVLLFVNTHADGGGKQELLGDGTALSRWIAETEIGSTAIGAMGTRADGRVADGRVPDGRVPDGRVTASDADADAAVARELRDALITVLLTHSGDDGVAGEALADAETFLWSIADRFPLTSVVTAKGANLVSRQTGVQHLMGTVLAAVVEAALSGDWARVKACRNPPCHTGFFDHSRNRTAGFCSSGCRSQTSMRAYRARRKASPDDPAES